MIMRWTINAHPSLLNSSRDNPAIASDERKQLIEALNGVSGKSFLDFVSFGHKGLLVLLYP